MRVLDQAGGDVVENGSNGSGERPGRTPGSEAPAKYLRTLCSKRRYAESGSAVPSEPGSTRIGRHNRCWSEVSLGRRAGCLVAGRRSGGALSRAWFRAKDGFMRAMSNGAIV